MPKIYVATPAYGGQIMAFYMLGVINLFNLARDLGIEVEVDVLANESLITRGRNTLTHRFLKSNATHLMFIDADISFDPRSILQMVGANVDIITGLYPKKSIDWGRVESAVKLGVPKDQLRYHTGDFVVNLVDYATEVTVPMGQPLEILAGGTGFMLIQRQVLERMRPHVPVYKHDCEDLSGSVKPAEEISEFFATSIDPPTQRLLSEDYHFCFKWRALGGKVHLAPWVPLAHVGTYIFEGRLFENKPETTEDADADAKTRSQTSREN